jgi:alpha/beta hydrolase family protein
MRRTNHSILIIALAAVVVALSVMTTLGQLPIPVQGERGAQGEGQRGQRGQGRGQQPAQPQDPPPVVSPVASASAEIMGPGKFFETLMELKPGDDLAHFKYVTKEYFVSGTANGQPYKTRIVIRKPADDSKASGLVLAESMHPSGNPWVFHFTHTYSMTEGHIGLEILTTTPQGLIEFNRERYKDLSNSPAQTNDIIAQVGALIKSKRPDNPLAGIAVRKMILTGSSASAGVMVNYLPAHMVLRLADMKPIYDGFMPTSNGANLRMIDVPMIQVPTMRETMNGATTRIDGDTPGNQFRVYEFAGMGHIDSRDAVAYYPDPCKLPISRFPLAAYMSVALYHLWQWLDKGTVPPHADRIYMDYNTDGDGSLMALDEYGNVRGGIRNPYVDFPTKKIGVPNSGAEPPIKNPHPFIAARGEAAQNQLCSLANYELPLTQEQLKKLYKDKKDYQTKVQQRYDELMKQGWALPVYRSVVLGDATKVSF